MKLYTKKEEKRGKKWTTLIKGDEIKNSTE